MSKVTIIAQIAEVNRELAMRRNVYPSLVRNQKLRQSEADLCLSRMEAVLATLMFCQKHEAAIREFIATKKHGEVPA